MSDCEEEFINEELLLEEVKEVKARVIADARIHVMNTTCKREQQ